MENGSYMRTKKYWLRMDERKELGRVKGRPKICSEEAFLTL